MDAVQRRLATVVAAAVLVGAVGGAWAASRGQSTQAPISAALATIPAGSGTVDLTVWEDLPDDVTEASLQGLTNRSVLATLDGEIEAALGWSPTDLSWEAYARTTKGGVTVMALGDLDAGELDQSWDAVANKVDGRWELDTTQRVTSDFADTFAMVQVLGEYGLMVAAPTPEALNATVRTVEGRSRSLLADRSVAGLADETRALASVMIQADTAWCAGEVLLDESELLALRSAEDVGGGPLTDPQWAARGMAADGNSIVFATAFASTDEAREQERVRTELTTGRFLGRFGEISDSLTGRKITVDEAVVAYQFTLTEDAEDFMVGAGPVLFNGCAVPSPA